MEGEILSSMAHIFLVKGNDVEIFPLAPIMKFDPENPNIESPSRARMKELMDEGYELAVDDGSEKSKMMKSAINRNSFMTGRSFDYLSSAMGDKTHEKVLRNVKSLAKYVPSIVGFSTPIGAIASGLLYAGTSKPLNAMEPDYFNTPFQPQGFTPTDTSPRISELFNRDPVVFDRHMQDKIQNTQGIMRVNANRERTASRVDPQGNIRAYGLKRGGIASL